MFELIRSFGGQAKWDEHIHNLVVAVGKSPGGLTMNWFQFRATLEGCLGLQCFTCGNSITKVGSSGRAGSNPFHYFVSRHLDSDQHERAREQACSTGWGGEEEE